jgi:hypothetical protein
MIGDERFLRSVATNARAEGVDYTYSPKLGDSIATCETVDRLVARAFLFLC